jgi:hypothetical protein
MSGVKLQSWKENGGGGCYNDLLLDLMKCPEKYFDVILKFLRKKVEKF